MVTLDNGKVRCEISEYNKRKYASFRKMYEVDGELRYGKQGISFSLEVWNEFKGKWEEIKRTMDEGFWIS